MQVKPNIQLEEEAGKKEKNYKRIQRIKLEILEVIAIYVNQMSHESHLNLQDPLIHQVIYLFTSFA